MTGPRTAILVAAAMLVLAAPVPAAVAERPSVVLILLDTTRADRFGSWGSGVETTPALDALAAQGAQFVRHFANSHATRPSLPQIVSGRYFHPSVLRPFQADSHPRDYPFLVPDPDARLVTDLLRAAGYRLLGASAHPWVDPASRMGRAFDHLEYVPAASSRGHADGSEVVDRAITLWGERPADQPTFLYVHLLDAHTPRWLPEGAPAFLERGLPWEDRFGQDGEPKFGAERRAWDFTDARDFTPQDREVYGAIYDTLLRHQDGHVGRLLERLRRDDPTLARTMVVVLADHGEQLGEEGHIRHGDSLIDAVQHIPLIVAGAGVEPGQRIEVPTENVDVAPTLARLLGLAVPPDAFDGRALLETNGRVCTDCTRRPAVYYAWSDYTAVRTSRWLLRLDPSGAPAARCRGGEMTLWRLDSDGRRHLSADARRARTMRRKLERRLGPKAAMLDAGLRTQPAEPFFVAVEDSRLENVETITCVPIDGGIDAAALKVPGWLLVRNGLTVVQGDAEPLRVRLTVPDGVYQVAAGVRHVGWLWRLPGLFSWAREAFHGEEAESFVELGSAQATGRTLHIPLPSAVGRGYRIVNFRLTPIGAATKDAPSVDQEHLERLRTLGYVE